MVDIRMVVRTVVMTMQIHVKQLLKNKSGFGDRGGESLGLKGQCGSLTS